MNVVSTASATSVRGVCAVSLRNHMQDNPGEPRELAHRLVAVAGGGCLLRGVDRPCQGLPRMLVGYTPSLGSHVAACDARALAIYDARDLLMVRNDIDGDIDAGIGTRWDVLALLTVRGAAQATILWVGDDIDGLAVARAVDNSMV
jgi:hypothetical protein